MFSARTAWPLAANRLHQLAQARRSVSRGDEDFLDLTASNPTVCGFDYPRAALLAALGSAAALRYEPQPLGLEATRQAVAAYYSERGSPIAPERLLLTASTSEAYAHLFRLLCDAGDSVLMPAPSYPLFEMLAGLSDVRLLPVPMTYACGWHLDVEALAAAADPRTRVLLLVHPNNPAGCYIKPEEWTRLQALARERAWALVVDEVFYDYSIPPAAPARLDLDACAVPTFLLNGLSKTVALPQMKLAWISVHGPAAPADTALARLEVINDLFLSASGPIQHAAPALLAARHGLQRQIRSRLAVNLAALDLALAAAPGFERLRVEGGWSVVLRLPRIHTDEAWAELLLERAGVLAHPGHFYGFAEEACLVLSLLLPPEAFAPGVARLLAAAISEVG